MSKYLADPIAFTKMNAGGNDFLCVDNTNGEYSELLASEFRKTFISELCKRGLAVGADGIIFACDRGNGDGVDIVARFMEPDGSEASLCGNGTACFAYWAMENKLVQGPEVNILTGAGTARARRSGENPHRIMVCVPNPHDFEKCVDIEVDHELRRVHLINTGVPHTVLFVDDLEEIDVLHLGRHIRDHERFAGMEQKENVNFTHLISEGHIAVRTFESGVECETLACGTGSTAAAIVSALLHRWDDKYLRGEEPVCVNVRGGEQLRIWFTCDREGTEFNDTCLETGAYPVYEGTVHHTKREQLEESFRKFLETEASPEAE